MEENDITSKAIDKIFSMKKTTYFLILIFLLGFTLRLIAAINLSVAADDMHFVTHAINFYSADRLVTYDQSSGLWFAFTSIIYKFFGLTQLTSRFAALFFGSFSVLVIYLLSREFFNEKISLIAAFLLAISTFHIKNTVAEMDVMAMFFVLLGMFIYIRALKTSKTKYFIISGVAIGLAIYTKVYPLLFIPSLLLFTIYYNKKTERKIFTKNNTKKILFFLIVIFIFTIPALTHNYLLYKDKGFLDLQFTRTLGLGKNISEQYYGWDYQFSAKNDWKGMLLGKSIHRDNQGPPLIIEAINIIRLANPLNFYLGILGIILIAFSRKKYRNYLAFFFLSMLFVLPFLASIILLGKHYLFLEILLIPMSALTLNEINVKTTKVLKKDKTKAIMLIVLLFSLFYLGLNEGLEAFYSKSHIAQIIEFKDLNMPKESLIVADSRIYRGRINWFSQGRPYLEGTSFVSAINQQDTIAGEALLTDTYFIECITDDCGWGTVKNQPEFNASMESLTDFFKENGQLVKTISEPEEKPYYPLFKGNKMEIINIHKAIIPIKQSVIAFANQPKEWFLYNAGYYPVDQNFDYYETHNFIDFLLDSIAHWIVLIALILASIAPIYVIHKIIKR
jgi:4-amino-4-deoxy-L-arabinose transferase-like glycosyltransferase